jgi:hypothetical protein
MPHGLLKGFEKNAVFGKNLDLVRLSRYSQKYYFIDKLLCLLLFGKV